MTPPDDISALIERDRPGFRAATAFRADITRAGRLQAEWLVAGRDGIAQVGGGSVTWLQCR